MIDLNYKNVVNLTPHAIIILDEDGNKLTSIPPSGTVARVDTERKQLANLNYDGVKIPITKLTSIGDEVINLPDPEDDTIYIVSNNTAKACPHRSDLYVADEVVKDPYTGRTVGCKRLSKPYQSLRICPYCGGFNPENALFCCHCGNF